MRKLHERGLPDKPDTVRKVRDGRVLRMVMCCLGHILAYLDRGTACLPYAGKRLRPACCIGKGDRLVFSMRPQLLSSRNFLVPSRQDAKGPADYWRVLEQPRWRISWARSMITEVSTGIRYICRFDRIVGGYQGLSSRMAR